MKRPMFVLIGGGIVGAITANSTAKLTSQHGLFYKYLYDEYGADFAKLYLESNENGIKLAEEIIQNENIDCDFEKKDS